MARKKKETKKEEAPKITKEALVAAAEDLNKVCGWAGTKDALDTELEESELELELKDASQDLKPTDVLKLETIATLVELECELPEFEEAEKEVEEAEEKTEEASKPVKGKAKKAAPKEKEEDKPKDKKKKISITRAQCFIDEVNKLEKPMSVDNFAEKINNTYIDSGGKDNVKQTTHLIKVMLPCAIGFGKIKINNAGNLTPC